MRMVAGDGLVVGRFQRLALDLGATALLLPLPIAVVDLVSWLWS